MKVLFDHQTFEFQKFGGISKYFCELYKFLNSTDSVTSLFSVLYSDNIHLHEVYNQVLPENYIYRKFRFVPFRGKVYKELSKKFTSLLPDIANRNNSIKILKEGDYDVFHPTYYDTYYNGCCSKPTVVTVHDMIHEYYPQYFDNDLIVKKRLSINKANRIIAVSNFTKQKLCEFYGVDENKIDVVYHGVSRIDGAVVNSAICNSKPFILYVGTRDKYKNFYFYLIGIAPILKSYDIDLIAVGAAFSSYELMYINHLGLSDRVKVKTSLSEVELATYYRQCVFVAYPSLIEGFGMPILEAYSCGAAVMMSDIPVFREVAGDDGIFFDCNNEFNIREVTEYYLQNTEKLSESAAYGRRRAEGYKWDFTARDTLKVYENCL